MLDQENRSSVDPLGHYRALGVGPLADASEIKAAYRYKAKLLHPDRNPSAEAEQEWLAVCRAYELLGNGEQRRYYDAQTIPPAPSGLIDPEDPAPQPLSCSRCGQVTAQPRYLIFTLVTSRLWTCRKQEIRGIFCRSCADRTAILASTANWVLGWWSLPGLYWTPRALIGNLKGGQQPPNDNLWVLLHQSRAFLARGESDIARALAEQALPFSRDDDERTRIKGLLQRAGSRKGRRLKNRWHPCNYATLAQALPLGALLLAIATGIGVVAFRSHPDLATADITVQAAQPGEIRHVATEILKVRLGPSATQPVTALLDRFATVQVIETEPDSDWARILTENGVSGYVQSRFLFGGPGDAQKTRWCTDQKGAPPQNGDILLRRAGGNHRLLVQNDSGRDMVVRLKTQSGRTLLSFFVERAKSTAINAIPEGTYHALFASGSDYSHVCGVFLQGMTSYDIPAALPLVIRAGSADQQDLKLILPPIGSAAGQSHVVPDEKFLDD